MNRFAGKVYNKKVGRKREDNRNQAILRKEGEKKMHKFLTRCRF